MGEDFCKERGGDKGGGGVELEWGLVEGTQKKGLTPLGTKLARGGPGIKSRKKRAMFGTWESEKKKEPRTGPSSGR